MFVIIPPSKTTQMWKGVPSVPHEARRASRKGQRQNSLNAACMAGPSNVTNMFWWTSPHTITVVAPPLQNFAGGANVVTPASCHTVVSTRSTVYRDPKAAQGTSMADCGVADGWQPKRAPNSTLQGKPACWGVTRSPTAVVLGPRDIKR